MKRNLLILILLLIIFILALWIYDPTIITNNIPEWLKFFLPK